jgi:hypothetical protein
VFLKGIAAILGVTLATGAHAHGWYEAACCSGTDCAPVDDAAVEEMADGVHVDGFGVLSYSDPRLRWSKDFEAHVCATATAPRRLLCVYRRPKSD